MRLKFGLTATAGERGVEVVVADQWLPAPDRRFKVAGTARRVSRAGEGDNDAQRAGQRGGRTMRRRIRGSLTYANVMSTLAVFGMLATGSAFAVSRIGTKDIKNGAITANKLHANAVTTQTIRNGAVTAAKVASHSLTGANILVSSLGVVPSATSATNATNLGGSPPATYRDHCPSGMALTGAGKDLCVDTSDRATNVVWSDAANACAAVRLRLPTVGEALQASFPNEHFWTDDVYNDAAGGKGWEWTGATIDNAPRANLYNARCVARPSDA
jgi:hypothetical protein